MSSYMLQRERGSRAPCYSMARCRVPARNRLHRWVLLFFSVFVLWFAAQSMLVLGHAEEEFIPQRALNQPELVQDSRALAATAAAPLQAMRLEAGTPAPTTGIPNSALSPSVLSTAQQAALCAELCPNAVTTCAIKFIYGTGTTCCCSGAFFVRGSIGHLCSDQSIPKLVPESLLNQVITAANASSTGVEDKPPGAITKANASALHLAGRSGLDRINQVRAAQRREPIIWSQAVYESVSFWLSYLDTTHLFITQNLGKPAKPFPPGALFLAEVVLAQRLPENVTAEEAGIACGNALLNGNISAEITLANYEFGAVGTMPRSSGPEWLCSISLGNMFRYGGTSFPNATGS
jgi:hypothetical protein